MRKIGKRVIVPGMFALSRTINLASDELKYQTNAIRVLFNSLLNSGDFVTLKTYPNPDDPSEIRLSAINHKDTLTSSEEFTRLYRTMEEFDTTPAGILRRLEIEPGQMETFTRLVGATDTDIAHFLFAIAYASHALLTCINQPQTEVEKEIDGLINGSSKISPFYQSLDIFYPSPFPQFVPVHSIDYYINYIREKALRLYTAHVICVKDETVVFRAEYKMVGIPDRIILRMAKDAHPSKPAFI
jgi:hypothetical protein